jgi:hypothetical protein
VLEGRETDNLAVTLSRAERLRASLGAGRSELHGSMLFMIAGALRCVATAPTHHDTCIVCSDGPGPSLTSFLFPAPPLFPADRLFKTAAVLCSGQDYRSTARVVAEARWCGTAPARLLILRHA